MTTQTVTQDSNKNQVQSKGYRLPETDGAKVLPTSDQVLKGVLPCKHSPDGATSTHPIKQACYSFIDNSLLKFSP